MLRATVLFNTASTSADTPAESSKRSSQVQKVLSTYDYAEEIAGGLWASIQAALAVGGGTVRASIPEDRSDRQDWVREGLRLPK